MGREKVSVSEIYRSLCEEEIKMGDFDADPDCELFSDHASNSEWGEEDVRSRDSENSAHSAIR